VSVILCACPDRGCPHHEGERCLEYAAVVAKGSNPERTRTPVCRACACTLADEGLVIHDLDSYRENWS
jgi:hypothetical protein